MKILHISKFYPPYRGGIEDVCYNIVNGMVGVEQKVICFNHTSHTEILEMKGVEIARIGIITELARQPVSFSFFFLLKKYIKDFSPDIIHLHLPNPLACLYILLLLPSRTKLLLHWHSDIVAQKFIYRFIRPLERKILKRADKVIITSPNYLEASKPLKDFYNKTVVVPNMVSLEKISDSRDIRKDVQNLRHLYQDKDIVFFMGRHVPYKGIEFLLEAEKYIGSDCVILIAGSGPLTEQLKKRNTSSRIKFIGKITDLEVKIYMTAASVFAFPSITKNEAFGVVLAEAMYCKSTPVTFEIKGSGVNWVSIKDVTGLEVENGNAKLFGEAINSLLENKILRNKLAEQGYKRVIENFTMESIQKKLELIYQELVS